MDNRGGNAVVKIRLRIDYHFLCRGLRHDVAISLVVDLDILDVVAVGDVDLAIDVGGRCRGRGLYACGRDRRRCRLVDIPAAAFPALELLTDSRRNGRW